MRRFFTVGYIATFTSAAVLSVSFANNATALTIDQILRIAKTTSVKISDQVKEGIGTGVIIERDGNTYTVLTAAHVIYQPQTYTITTSDGRSTLINSNHIKKFPSHDLALLKFKSRQAYPIVELSDSTRIKEGEPCYTFGFPSSLENSIDSKNSIADLSHFSRGTVSAKLNQVVGYQDTLTCTSSTFPGMSGGPTLNQTGKLVGILSTYVGLVSFPKPSDFIAVTPTNTFLSLVPKVDSKLSFPKPVTTSNYSA